MQAFFRNNINFLPVGAIACDSTLILESQGRPLLDFMKVVMVFQVHFLCGKLSN
jgi:hypothetical protein